MGKLGYFLGGLLAGAAGLIGTVLLHDKLKSSGKAADTSNKSLEEAQADGSSQNEEEQPGVSNTTNM